MKEILEMKDFITPSFSTLADSERKEKGEKRKNKIEIDRNRNLDFRKNSCQDWIALHLSRHLAYPYN